MTLYDAKTTTPIRPATLEELDQSLGAWPEGIFILDGREVYVKDESTEDLLAILSRHAAGTCLCWPDGCVRGCRTAAREMNKILRSWLELPAYCKNCD